MTEFNNTNNTNTVGTALSWDAQLPAGEPVKPKKIVLDEGEHDYVITDFERGFFAGSAKLPACNMAIVKMAVDAGDGRQAMHEERFYLTEKMTWKLSAFFCSLGLMQPGVPGQMRWDKIVGQRGRAYFKQKNVQGKTGNITVNVVDHFIDSESPASTTPQTPIPQNINPFGPGNRAY